MLILFYEFYLLHTLLVVHKGYNTHYIVKIIKALSTFQFGNRNRSETHFCNVVSFLFAEVLSAIISVLLVYILMAFLLYEAVQRTIHMDYEINGDIMLITAAVGVAVNLM